MASESAGFGDAQWLPYTKIPDFTASSNVGKQTVYFKVKDRSGKESAVAPRQVFFRKGKIT